MAASSIEERLCESCMGAEKKVKARTLCYECHELLCEPCSDSHLNFEKSREHNLIELVQFMKKPATSDSHSPKRILTSVKEVDLNPDPLEHVSLNEDTFLYRGAQVAVEGKDTLENKTCHEHIDPTRLKATKCFEISVKTACDQVNAWITGVQCVSDNIIIVDRHNKVLKLFDQNGAYLSSTQLEVVPWGITYVQDNTFVTCGDSNTVYLWTVRRQGLYSRTKRIVTEKESYRVDHNAHCINYNGTYYCVLHRDFNAITILDRKGKQVRKIITKEAFGRKFNFGWGLNMDTDTNNIYVSCNDEEGVLCMTIEGQALWFTPLSGYLMGMTSIHGTLCIVDSMNNCLHLMTSEGGYVNELLDKVELGGKPRYVCCGLDGQLYITYYPYSMSTDTVRVYTIFSDNRSRAIGGKNDFKAVHKLK